MSSSLSCRWRQSAIAEMPVLTALAGKWPSMGSSGSKIASSHVRFHSRTHVVITPMHYYWKCQQGFCCQTGAYVSTRTGTNAIKPSLACQFGFQAQIFVESAGHAPGQFLFTKEHSPDSLLAQQLRSILAMGPQDDLDARVELSRRIRHLANNERVGGCNDQHRGFGDMGLNQYRGFSGVARHNGDASLAQIFHQLPILLGYDVRDASHDQRL